MLVQGDVFLIRVEDRPNGLNTVSRENGKLILAEGEATGHHHAIADTEAELWQDPKNEVLYLEATKEVTLTHQEHKPITIAPGNYKVGIVQEYDYFLEEARKVVD